MTVAFAPSIVNVVTDDLCISCGACVYACPAGSIRPQFNPVRGAHEVEVVDFAACEGCAAPCDMVCPSLEVDLLQLLGTREPVPREGPISSMWIGHSQEHRDNGVSSSGGILRAFIADALESGQPVVCLTGDDGDYGAEVIAEAADLRKVPGSIYHSVSFDRAIGLIQSLDRQCLLVATPCQLEGILKYCHSVEPRLLETIGLTVGLICGWMYTHHSLAAFASYKAIPGPITDASYRGEDEVGLLKLRAGDGATYAFHRRVFDSWSDRLDYQASFSRFANRLRCRLCENHVNVLSDVAVGDAWLARKRGEKASIVVVRTERGERALAELHGSGRLELEPAQAGDLIESQSLNLVHGVDARKLNGHLASKLGTTPRFVFDAADSPPRSPRLSKRIEFAFEMIMRRQLRAGRYQWYRTLFTVRDLARLAARRVLRR